MHKKRIVLRFPKELVDQEFVYRLAKDFNLEFNILKAEVNPQEEGIMVLELKGDDQSYRAGVNFLKSSGVKVQPLAKDIIMDKEKCTDCTLCVSLCPTKALVKDQKTFEVKFIKEKCIACGVCVYACPYGAMSIKF